MMDFCTCDSCDKRSKNTVHFDLLGTAYVLCQDCINILHNANNSIGHICNCSAEDVPHYHNRIIVDNHE